MYLKRLFKIIKIKIYVNINKKLKDMPANKQFRIKIAYKIKDAKRSNVYKTNQFIYYMHYYIHIYKYEYKSYLANRRCTISPMMQQD